MPDIPDEQLEAGVVIRFGLRSVEDMYYADKHKPHVTDFDLGSREAADTHFASLSVWDESRTNVEQARAFLSAERRLPIWLSVKRILELPHDLRVIRAPHPIDLPGREVIAK